MKKILFYFFKIVLILFLLFELIISTLGLYVEFNDHHYLSSFVYLVFTILYIFAGIYIIRKQHKRYFFMGMFTLAFLIISTAQRHININSISIDSTDLGNFRLFFPFFILALILDKFSNIEGTRTTPATPEEAYISQWSWGGFLIPPIWSFASKVPKWALFYFISLIFPVISIVLGLYLGSRGRKLAWESGKWGDFTEFKKQQRVLDISGFLIALVIFSIWIVFKLLIKQ